MAKDVIKFQFEITVTLLFLPKCCYREQEIEWMTSSKNGSSPFKLLEESFKNHKFDKFPMVDGI